MIQNRPLGVKTGQYRVWVLAPLMGQYRGVGAVLIPSPLS
jgi:hypothetical protein